MPGSKQWAHVNTQTFKKIMRTTELIQDQIRLGVMSFRQIAEYFHVSLSDVNTIWEEMCEQEFSE